MAIRLAALAVSTSLAACGPALAGPPDEGLIDEVCGAIRDNYVYPDKGEATAALIRDRYGSGAYDDLGTQELAAALMQDCLAVTHDRHFRVMALPPGWSPPPAEEREGAPLPPHGFYTVERLPGNIGYLDLRNFATAAFAEDTLNAAMLLLDGSSAVILDLRRNGGGDPETVRLLCSYFFDPAEPVHLNSLYWRPTDETTEFWTQDMPGEEMPGTPLYVLTSSYTFSGAEECAYNLRTRGRATLIGETTGGGAHPVDGFPVRNTLMVTVPIGRAINPVTGTNWEGTGVQPHAAVPAGEALDVALERALTGLAEGGDEDAAWALLAHRAGTSPIELDEDALAAYTGDYTDRHVRTQGDELEYRRDGLADWRRLVPVDTDTFMIEGVDWFRMVFERGAGGRITAIRGEYRGRPDDHSARTGPAGG